MTSGGIVERIARPVRHGLVASGFVPPPAIRDLREPVRHRRTLTETRTAARSRVPKLLEGANIKLSGVAGDVFGASGTAMLEALAAGTDNASERAGLARGRMRRKHAALEAAPDGRMREHRWPRPSSPGSASAWTCSPLPAAWRPGPGPRRAAAKARGQAEGRRDDVLLKAALFAAASAAVRTKGSHRRGKHSRLRARRGPVRAIMAVARKPLAAAFHMPGTGEAFRDLGGSCLDQVARKRSTAKLVQRLSNLGYEVMLVPKAAQSHPSRPSGAVSAAVSGRSGSDRRGRPARSSMAPCATSVEEHGHARHGPTHRAERTGREHQLGPLRPAPWSWPRARSVLTVNPAMTGRPCRARCLMPDGPRAHPPCNAAGHALAGGAAARRAGCGPSGRGEHGAGDRAWRTSTPFCGRRRPTGLRDRAGRSCALRRWRRGRT